MGTCGSGLLQREEPRERCSARVSIASSQECMLSLPLPPHSVSAFSIRGSGRAVLVALLQRAQLGPTTAPTGPPLHGANGLPSRLEQSAVRFNAGIRYATSTSLVPLPQVGAVGSAMRFET